MSRVLLQRLRDAATAAERLRIALSGESVSDPVEMAYLHRLLGAVAAIDEYTEADRRSVQPSQLHLGRLRHDPQTSASRGA